MLFKKLFLLIIIAGFLYGTYYLQNKSVDELFTSDPVSDSILKEASKSQFHDLSLKSVSVRLKQGHPDGYAELGSRLVEGRGVNQDIEKGVRLLLAGAEKGSIYAMEVLGKVCYQGDIELEEKFTHWYNMAAQRDSIIANHFLCTYHMQNKNYTEALSPCQRSAEYHKVPISAGLLGELYSTSGSPYKNRADAEKNLCFAKSKGRFVGKTLARFNYSCN